MDLWPHVGLNYETDWFLLPGGDQTWILNHFKNCFSLYVILGRRVGRSPLNSHPEITAETMCVASVALAIERSALLVDVFTFDRTKMAQDQDVARRQVAETRLPRRKGYEKADD